MGRELLKEIIGHKAASAEFFVQLPAESLRLQCVVIEVITKQTPTEI